MSPLLLKSWHWRMWLVCTELQSPVTSSQSLQAYILGEPTSSWFTAQRLRASSLLVKGLSAGREKSLELCIPYLQVVIQISHSCWGGDWHGEKGWGFYHNEGCSKWKEWTRRISPTYTAEPKKVYSVYPTLRDNRITFSNHYVMIRNHYFLHSIFILKTIDKQNNFIFNDIIQTW